MTPDYDQLAVALGYGDTLRTFIDEYAPSKLKWANLDRGDIQRFDYYDLLDPSPRSMGSQTVWEATDWVETAVFHEAYVSCSWETNAVKGWQNYGERLARIWDEETTQEDGTPVFVARDTDLNRVEVAHLSRYGMIEKFEDNTHAHEPTQWTLTPEAESLFTIREAL